ncbi:hypothetical protein L914_03034 [Phytophthora nicotianae]|uniref:BAT2 N-terminal domain-containing protein n=1 Tax=Phytophthora nicotianae TaxID=4792 RepID=W2NXM8_PHYNI|nr:hypothetical protein L914_03034 [Phytophthora nicotianae]
MNPTTNIKPKAKFSSRNLSAVFKAPLRTKPLPDNATGSLQRPNSRMLVLGRAAVAPPAPLNTPSMKRESQVVDVHVSLVPTSSNWAESVEKQQNIETPEIGPAPADVVALPEAPDKVWTPESVAEHLHTRNAPARPKFAIESSGRWGDDAVEQDIVQSNIRRQRQKEKEFPDLKEAAEETQIHHGPGEGYTRATDRSPSIDSQQPEQHHGRATGRWAHFNEQQEMHRPIQDNRWSHDRYEGHRWPHHGEDRWSRSRYDRDEDDRWSRGHHYRHNDDYGRDRPPYESSNDTISPVPNDSHTHFSRSDARFDLLVAGDRDRVLSQGPHRMDWESGRLARRDGCSSSPSRLTGPRDSCFRSPQPDRSPAPKTADVTPARAINWRNLSTPEEGSTRAWGRAATAPPKNEKPSTPVAEAVESSSTELSSNSSSNSSPSPQIQLLKRPKMLFDPKTGGMMNAKDKAASGKRQAGSRNGVKDRDGTDTAGIPRSNSASRRSNEKLGTDFNAAPTTSVIAVNSVQEVVVEDAAKASKDSSSVSSGEVLPEPTADKLSTKESNTKRAPKWTTTTKDPTHRESGYREKRRDSRNPAANVRDSSRPNNGKTRNDRAGSSTNKPARRRTNRKVTDLQSSQVTPQTIEMLKQISEGSTGGVVVLTDEQKGIEVSSEDRGFETVKSRRAVLNEKKQLRQRLASNELKSTIGEQQSKGEQVQETISMSSKAVDVQLTSNPRGKAANSRRNAEQRKPKSKTKQPKQAKSKHMPVKTADSAEAKQPASPAKPTEQVAGEAPTESTVSKKRLQYVKVVPAMEEKREQNPGREKKIQGSSTRKSSDRKPSSSSAGNYQKQEPTKRAAQKVSTRGSVAKTKPKQVRQVYVVKTPAPASSASSTAA